MIEDIWDMFVYMILAVAIVLWTIALFGCAQPDPPPPIQYYREQHGFTPSP